MIDIQIQLPTGEVRRVREVAPVQGRRAAERYEQQVRARLMLGEDLGREQEVIDDDDDDAVRVTVGKRWESRSAARTAEAPAQVPREAISTSQRSAATIEPAATTTARSRSRSRVRSNDESECPTLADFAPRFVEHHRAKGNKPGELALKEQVLAQHLIPAFGKLRLDAITAQRIDAYKAAKQRPARDVKAPKRVRGDRPRKTPRGLDGLKPHTVNNHLTILRSLLRLAARWDHLAKVPEFEMVREDVKDPEFLTFEEARRMIVAAEPEWRVFLVVAIGAGLRIGELRALRWQDIDMAQLRIRVAQNLTRAGIDTPKSRRPRTVKIGGDVMAALRGHPRHRSSDLVFHREDGSPLSMAQVRRAVEVAAKRAELGRSIRPGLLRHTFATHGVMGGVPLNVVQSWMGHSDIRVTMRYAHLAPDMEGDLAENVARRRRLTGRDDGAGEAHVEGARGASVPSHGTWTAHARHMTLSDNKNAV